MGKVFSFNLCCQGQGGHSETVLPSPVPRAQPVAPELASAPLGIPSPLATPAPPWPAGKSLRPGNPKQSWVCPRAMALPQAGEHPSGVQRGFPQETSPQAALTRQRCKRCSWDPLGTSTPAPHGQSQPTASHPVPGRDALLAPREREWEMGQRLTSTQQCHQREYDFGGQRRLKWASPASKRE